MIFALTYLRGMLGGLLREESAQDAFEYVLIIGGVSVAVIFAVATPVGGALINAVISGTCGAIATIVTQVNCTGI
jgi:Flp pilus assembly pilin Flp